MKSITKLLVFAAFTCMFWMPPAYGEQVTRLTVVESSSTSWVARGLENYTVTPDLGWTFTPSRNFDDGIGFYITGPALPDASDIDSWNVEFAAPFNDELTPGVYSDFQRWPFQDSDRPGLSFSSTGRTDNVASGSFEVLEVTYGPDGEVLSFAADFTHYGEANAGNFAVVELRYNSTVDLDVEVEVDIDIRPGGGRKPTNLRARGVLPVAIVSTEDFDALEVDAESVLFGDPSATESSDGAPVAPLRSTDEDVDGDGLDDLLLHFSISEIADAGALDGESVEAELTGETFDGTLIVGTDSVRIVPSR